MKLSIITINYNNRVGLEKTVKSVQSQTWRDFEWIIIDGGSTDGSKDVIESLPSNLVTYRCSEPDKGIYNAMNKGIVKAGGEYLQFPNSGDSYNNSEALDIVIPQLQGNDIYYGNCHCVGGVRDFTMHYPQELSLAFFLHSSIGHPSSFIKRELFSNRNYREDLHIVSDWAMFFQWFIEKKSFYYIDNTIVDYDYCGISSTNVERCNFERRIVISDMFGEKTNDYISQVLNDRKELELYRIYNLKPILDSVCKNRYMSKLFSATLRFFRLFS